VLSLSLKGSGPRRFRRPGQNMLKPKKDLKSFNSLRIEKWLKIAVTPSTPQFEKQKENTGDYSCKALMS
jgi:hypothetical protein